MCSRRKWENEQVQEVTQEDPREQQMSFMTRQEGMKTRVKVFTVFTFPATENFDRVVVSWDTEMCRE